MQTKRLETKHNFTYYSYTQMDLVVSTMEEEEEEKKTRPIRHLLSALLI